MPRTAIPVTEVPFSGGASPSFVAADAANGMMYPNTGNVILIVRNTDTAAHTVSVQSASDEYGRTVTKQVSVASGGGLAVLGPFRPEAFAQKSGTDAGKTYVSFDVATGVTVAAIKLTP